MTSERQGTPIQYWVINYKYANSKGQMRNGQLLLPAATPELVLVKAKDALASYDWFKLGTPVKA